MLRRLVHGHDLSGHSPHLLWGLSTTSACEISKVRMISATGELLADDSPSCSSQAVRGWGIFSSTPCCPHLIVSLLALVLVSPVGPNCTAHSVNLLDNASSCSPFCDALSHSHSCFLRSPPYEPCVPPSSPRGLLPGNPWRVLNSLPSQT